jgi:hypothetical protein
MVISFIKKAVKSVMRKFGFDIVSYTKYPLDFSSNNIEIYEAVKRCTMTGQERVNALIDAISYLEDNEIDGAIVECGVWKGGCIMAAALTLKRTESEDREFYLYDTFSGMTAPTDVDVGFGGESAHEIFSKNKTDEDASDWCLSPLEEVRENVFSTGYKKDKIHFIKGRVEDTIPKKTPKGIALLRLDTDWYESTKHELIHLFPLLNKSGVLIIDDYGDWQGARRAVDEYIKDNNIRILLNRVAGSRISVKQ